jgi:hypothetical protein
MSEIKLTLGNIPAAPDGAAVAAAMQSLGLLPERGAAGAQSV